MMKSQNTNMPLTLSLKGHTVNVTHPQKIYWPKEGYTKEDLVQYYRAIAPIILPYLKDRPESLHRFPNGITHPSFFHKNFENAPEWIKQEKIMSASHGMVNYILCQNEATLIYLVNLGCIEFNPWISRIQSLEKPDYCVIDLDPESIDFKEVVKTALSVHEVLEELSVAHYCKTSGGRGLHIYIPLQAKYDYEQSVKFAQVIGMIVNTRLPEITSLIRSPSKRQGKVYLDCLQNHIGQTLAAPYCARPRPGATVSTPLEWDEVNAKLHPSQFTIKTILKRLEKKEDIFKPTLGKGIKLESVLKKIAKNFKVGK